MLYYNNAFKNTYLSSIPRTAVIPAQKYFAESTEMENKKRKDIALFTKEEWFEYLQSINVITINKIKPYYDFYKKYSEVYFEKNKVDTENAYKAITEEDMVAYSNSIVNKEICLPREVLLTLVNEIPSPIDQFLVLALYEGIRGDHFQDITMLQTTDIDVENREFHLAGGNVVKVSEELLNIALKASKQTVYITPQSPFSNESASSVTLGQDEYIFKIRSNSKSKTIKVNPTRVYRKFTVLRQFFGNDAFDIPRIVNSGFVYGLNEILKKNGKESYREIADLPETQQLRERYEFTGGELKRVTERLKRIKFL